MNLDPICLFFLDDSIISYFGFSIKNDSYDYHNYEILGIIYYILQSSLEYNAGSIPRSAQPPTPSATAKILILFFINFETNQL